MKKSNRDLKQFIFGYIQESINSGKSPTVREICEALEIKSTSTVHRYIKELKNDGALIHDSNKSRSLSLLSGNTVSVPVIGKIRAGNPILAVEDIEGYVPVSNIKYQTGLFALRIVGDSMIDAGILEDDIIIAVSTNYAENGDIVVALIDDEATVKVFYKENGHFRLQPKNINYSPIISDDIKIIGKVISLIRSY